jgi:hypothetical protein
MPTNDVAMKAEATALMPLIPDVPVPLSPAGAAATALIPSILAGSGAIPSIPAIPMSPHSTAEEAVAPIPEAAVQEDIGEAVDLNEANNELEHVNDEDAGFDVGVNINEELI